MSSKYHKLQYFLLKLFTRFLFTNTYKRVFGIFLILFRSWVICKNKKDLVSTHSFFTFLLITQDLNKMKKKKKIPNTLLYTFLNRKHVQNFGKKLLNFMTVGGCQSFQFFRQITWFLGSNRALSKFRYRILHNLVSITKLKKNHSVKANFKLIMRATLKEVHWKIYLLFDLS